MDGDIPQDLTSYDLVYLLPTGDATCVFMFNDKSVSWTGNKIVQPIPVTSMLKLASSLIKRLSNVCLFCWCPFGKK